MNRIYFSNFVKKYLIMNKNTLKSIVITTFAILGFSSHAQNKTANNVSSSGYVKCYTVEHEADLKAKYPNRATTEEFERWLAPQVEKIKADRAAGRNIQAIYNIPVVIHIIHNGDAVGSGENISTAQAISQITVMNQDYRRMMGTPGGANTTGLAVDCEINFVIAQTNPTGGLTNGIDRVNIAPYTNAVADGPGGADWELKSDVEIMKAATIWDTSRYLNMWTVRVGGNPLPTGLGGLLGYAQFPDATGLGGLNASGGSATTDGVVASYDAFGTIALNNGSFVLNTQYNLGRTMTHEVGHWLGLRHIWGDNTNCTTNATDSTKDYCPDTPAANAANYTCNLSANTCPASPGNDQVQNYMDYTNDSCMDTFTGDQKARMQAIMAAAPRRNVLNTSTAGNPPAPYVSFASSSSSINEGTNCSFTDYNYPVNILKIATQNATVTFNSTASTATAGKDFQIMTPTANFVAGSTTSQNLTVRVFNDGISEGAENIVVGMTLNANGGDAVLDPLNTTLTLTLVDNDLAALATQQNVLFSDGAEALVANSTVTFQDFDGDTKKWGTFNTSASSVGYGVTGRWFGSRSYDASGALTPDNLITFNTAVAIPAGTTQLKFKIGANDVNYPAEKYSVYATSTTLTTQAAANAATPLLTEVLTVGGVGSVSTRTIDVSSLAGQTVYISFRHYQCTDKNVLILDDVEVSSTVSASVQTAVNTATAYTATLNTTGTMFAKDATTSKTIADLTSTTNFDYGCATVSVSRDQATAGAAAVNFGTNTANSAKVLAKTVTIATTNPNTSGAGSIKFYFSEAEIAAWETATGTTRANLGVFKTGATSLTTATLGAFGNNVTLTAPVTNGLPGVYYFGTASTLSNTSFELADSLLVFPNPTKGTLNINIEGYAKASYSIYNTIGQLIKEKTISSENDLKVSTSDLTNGVYLIKISKDGESKTVQFVKE